MAAHTPVLLTEACSFLNLTPGATVVDATLGDGGHAAAILEQTAPNGRLIGLDADPAAVATAREHLASYGDRTQLVVRNFRYLASVLADLGRSSVDAILADLGLSSRQLGDASRGFAFQLDGPLDMRLDAAQGNVTAASIVNTWHEGELTELLREHGDEPAAHRIVSAIIAHRRTNPFITTRDLADVVSAAVHGRRRRGLHPATRTFQALRIAVNQELDALAQFLPQACDALRPGGRLVVISFHSGEDRIVKQTFRTLAAQGRATILTKHVVPPSRAEALANPRSRSAKLRTIEALPHHSPPDTPTHL